MFDFDKLGKKALVAPFCLVIVLACVLSLAVAPLLQASPHDVSLAIVNLDEGVSTPAGTANAGAMLASQLTGEEDEAPKESATAMAAIAKAAATASGTETAAAEAPATSASAAMADSLAWETFDTEDELHAQLNDNNVFGGIVIPADFTAQQLAAKSGGADKPHLTVHLNMGKNPQVASSLQTAMAQSLASAGVDADIEMVNNADVGAASASGPRRAHHRLLRTNARHDRRRPASGLRRHRSHSPAASRGPHNREAGEGSGQRTGRSITNAYYARGKTVPEAQRIAGAQWTAAKAPNPASEHAEAVINRSGKMGPKLNACFNRSRRMRPKLAPFPIKEERVSSSTFGHRRKTPEISVHFWPREGPRPGPDAIFGRSGKESSRRNSVSGRSGKAVLPGDAVLGRSGSKITREKASKVVFEVEWEQNHGIVGITFIPQRPKTEFMARFKTKQIGNPARRVAPPRH